jgi:hypothetical protein
MSRLTRTGVKKLLNKEFSQDVGDQLQAIGTLVRLMNEVDVRVPIRNLTKNKSIVGQSLEIIAGKFNENATMDEFSQAELKVPVELGIAVGGDCLIFALGDEVTGTTSQIIWEDK